MSSSFTVYFFDGAIEALIIFFGLFIFSLLIIFEKVRQRHRPWRWKRETCEKGLTWTDWISTSSRPSRQSRSAILQECSPVVPHVQTIEALACQNSFSAAC